ncbi:hypothetical protein BGX23_002966 [Mortierella sp. AD031]|nr:hypothetical protein BGX23_002966 [Mortierella sp. AD031]
MDCDQLQSDNGDREKWCCESVVQGFFGPISSIAWKPEALEFVTGCEDGSTRVWKMRSESDGYSVRLVWGSGCTALVAAGADFTNVVGFSTINRHLLKQRNALGVTSDSEDDGSEDD